MRRSLFVLSVMAIVAVLLGSAGCRRNTYTRPQPLPKTEKYTPSQQAEAPAPTISLSLSPSAIEKGQSTVLSWNSSNATGVTINNGIGTVEASGNRTIKPLESTTYTAKASGPGGNAVAEARLTVSSPPDVTPPKSIGDIGDAPDFEAHIRDIFFDYDQYNISESSRDALLIDASLLKRRPNIRITIEGHCDERGSEKYNLALGDQRANATKEFLVGQGINGNRIDTISYGEERPFCEDSATEQCWQQNRRAHFVMRSR
jgi:peptidoglycan-associated lipoprotein